MRGTGFCCFVALALTGCFSDPPPGTGAGESSGGSSSSSGVGASTSDASTTMADATSGGSEASSSTLGSTSSEGTSSTTQTGTGTGGPVPTLFCAQRSLNDAFACTDFEEGPTGVPWEEPMPVGYTRQLLGDPPPMGGDTFVRLTRAGDAAGTSYNALYETTELTILEGRGISTAFGLRFPADFQSCSPGGVVTPRRVYSVDYTPAGSTTRTQIVVEASPESVRVAQAAANSSDELFEFQLTEQPGMHGWFAVEITVLLPTADSASPSLEVRFGSQSSGGISLPGENAGSYDLQVDVGPHARPINAPPMGCSYDLDNIVALPFQP